MVAVFFFNDTATTEIYTLSLHDALPIFDDLAVPAVCQDQLAGRALGQHPRLAEVRREDVDREPLGDPEGDRAGSAVDRRSEEHTSELQSRQYLVCRLLLEKKQHRMCTRS